MKANVNDQPKSILLQITQGIPKPVVYTLISAIIIGAVTLSFAFIKTTGKTNADLPIEQRKTTEIKNNVERISIDVEILKVNGANTNQKINDISTKQDNDHDLLLELKTLLKQVNNNTK